MLVIKVELWPHGDRTRARELCRMAIWNDGTGTAEVGNYGVVIPKSASHGAARPGVWRSGTVTRFPRTASSGVGVWDLLRSALNNVLGRRREFGGTAGRPGGTQEIARMLDDNAPPAPPAAQLTLKEY